MAGTMTDRERFVRQMHYAPVDRCFNMEFGYWDDNFEVWPIFKDNGITNNHDADIFNFDRIELSAGGSGPPDLSGDGRRGARDHEDTDERGRPAGRAPKDGHDTIPHYIKATVVTPDDWAKVKEERFRRDDLACKADLAKLKERHPRAATIRSASRAAR